MAHSVSRPRSERAQRGSSTQHTTACSGNVRQAHDVSVRKHGPQRRRPLRRRRQRCLQGSWVAAVGQPESIQEQGGPCWESQRGLGVDHQGTYKISAVGERADVGRQ